jgi:hypothetical protein
MFEKLRKFFSRTPLPFPPDADDPELGALKWSRDDEAWLTRPEHRGTGFAFLIAGEEAPNPALVRHARDILLTREAFVRDVHRFLAAELESISWLKMRHMDEVSGLKIDMVACSGRTGPTTA